jgi:hypothetical protein
MRRLFNLMGSLAFQGYLWILGFWVLEIFGKTENNKITAIIVLGTGVILLAIDRVLKQLEKNNTSE